MERSTQKERNFKLMFIAPTAYMKQFTSQGGAILALAHLIARDEVNEYEQAILDIGLPVLLDNSAFELHRPEGIDSLIAKALRIKATHFFAPDFLYDAKATKEAYQITCSILDKLGVRDLKMAVVVQGKTEQEYFELYDYFVNEERVDLIGISILAVPRCFGSWNKREKKKLKRGEKAEEYKHDDREIVPSRIQLLERLLQRGGNAKDLHLLGLGSGLQDIIFAAKNCPFVKSHDSSSAFWSAIQGKRILEDGLVEGGKTEIKVDFNFDSATKEQLELAQKNIEMYKKLLK